MDKIKVLYVEDEPFLAQIVRESLSSRNFDVKHISDGNRVMEAYETFQPHICVLDVMLPGIDGFELGKKIRNKSTTLPIIFLTAKTQVEDVLQGFSQGGNDYLKKPFSMEELIARIENLIRLSGGKSTENQMETYSIGEYLFTPKQYELNHHHHTKKLSHRESTLLQMLVEGKEEPVLRKDILMKIWGDDSFYNSRNLDVYITKLREYLKGDSHIEIITIKGLGYHLIVKTSS